MSLSHRRIRRTMRSMNPDRGRARREEDDEEKNELLDLFV
jgi:hypothetical protein